MPRIFIIMIFLLLSGCAANQAKQYEFIPPANKSGMVCVQQCGVAQTRCQNQQRAGKNQCIAKARQQARIEMPGRIKAYEAAIDEWEKRIRVYQRDVSRFEFERRHYRMMHHLSAGNCKGKNKKHNRDCKRNFARWRGPFWIDEPVYPGPAPRRPTLERVTRELAKENCAGGNQCAVTYRQCYSSCGGTVRVK